ncbi:C-terminal domain of CHU protein family protein [Algoriphagus faecimaris]|uniref:C-terminal domain of CHU protein family protein n=1 Tax=Algoriphagus faecimaris TaxID=686796 RepID=A0A1G6SD82_9BACT|nr:gliding motility-associated C-terminal domain-containing protein [Algoriphagus faecimaris]SDD14829.1 C-terminal domain of CHU protein family protein [Algoriphagus faecimaris]
MILFRGSAVAVILLSCFLLFTSISAEKAAKPLSSALLVNSIIDGPERLCIVFGSVIGDFTGLGQPGDVFDWELISPSGEVLFSRQLGSPGFSYTFSSPGVYQLSLDIRRGNVIVGSEVKPIDVLPSPLTVLESNYIICTGQDLTLSAIDPGSADFGDYVFEWTNSAGAVISTDNEAVINSPGTYAVEFYFVNSQGVNECVRTLSTTIIDINSFSVNSDRTEVCTTQFIEFQSSPSIEGDWYVQRQGETTRTFLGTSSDFSLFPSRDLDSPGDFTMIFALPNPNNPTCTAEIPINFTYYPEPRIEFEEAFGASDCSVDDGILKIRTLTDVDRVTIDSLGISLGPFAAFEIVEFPGLKSGAYTLSTALGSCAYSIGAVVPLQNPIPELEFQIIDIIPETCTSTGIAPGGFSIVLPNGSTTAGYQILTERGIPAIFQDTTQLNDTIRVNLSGGKYFFEIFDGNGCALPESEEIEIPGLSQVNFFVPANINVCQSFELYPVTSQALEFSLTDPDGLETIFNSGDFGLLDKAGTYTLVGRIPGQDVLCPFSREINVSLVDPIDFEPRLVQEDCFGNRVFEAEIFGVDPSTARFIWYDENDQVVSQGQFLIPVSTGEFKLDVQPINAQACPIPPKTFMIEEPVLSVDVTLNQTKLCEFGPEAIVSLESTFPEAVTDIRWRRFNEDGTVDDLPEFENLKEFQTRIAGTYEAALFRFIPGISVEECELGRETIELNLIPDKVLFDIPAELTVCENFELTPQTTESLEFTVTDPAGNTQTGSSGDSFTLELDGIYIFLAFDSDPNSAICPEQKELVVTLTDPVDFEPILISEDCNGLKTYQARVNNYQNDEVDYFWYDTNRNQIGDEEFLELNTYGDFSLEVQPSGSTSCPSTQRVNFTAETPVLSVDVNLTTEPLCPDEASTVLTLQADLTEITQIEWWFTDLSGNQSELVNSRGQEEILAFDEGTYEVRVFNDIPCLLGFDQALVLRSQDPVRPELGDTYQVCERYEIGPNLNPGSFASYEWYLGEDLVSTNPTFKPIRPGDYSLTVYSLEGCAYQASFTAEEECELKVIFPTAIIPGDPDKNFLIYTNFLIDELEVWIFNQWGQLIFYCENSSLISEESTCQWDGYFNGEKVPNGSYSVRINYVNLEKNISQYQLGSILVIE